MKTYHYYVALIAVLLAPAVGFSESSFIFPEPYPYPDKVGESSSTAIHKEDARIVAWASGFVDYSPGTDLSASWKNASEALGPAEGTSSDIVSLGRGGSITLSFENAITNGEGEDFAVFENSFSSTFLELAWVEVSSDGVHFVRFPNYSQTVDPVGGFGTVEAFKVYGYAGKYVAGYGTPFDLSELAAAYAAALADTALFSAAYEAHLINNFLQLDLDDIRYVRIIDVIGDGSQLSALRDPATDSGYPIYDPFPTSGSAGFDLDAVAVLNQSVPEGLEQMIDFPELENQRITDVNQLLIATASSGLPVHFEVLDGPATVSGNVLSFAGLGQVIVRASQPGDEIYAPANSVSRSFVIADELQHIYFEPIPNLLVDSTYELSAVSSSGLIPNIEIISGPFDASAGTPPMQTLTTGPTTGTLTLRASQTGGTFDGVTYAPAEEVEMTVAVVSAVSPSAPMAFAAWQEANALSGSKTKDSDRDGISDFEEYCGGTDPNDQNDWPVYMFEAIDESDGYRLEFLVSRLAPVSVQLQANNNLANLNAWANILPEIEEISIPLSSPDTRRMRLRLPNDVSGRNFWRIQFETK